jgi:hypothetical protein
MELQQANPATHFLRNTPQVGATCSEWVLSAAERVEDYLLGNGERFKRAMQLLPEQFALRQGEWRAKLAANRAWRQVPAYGHFLAAHGIASPPADFHALPVMSKTNYI